MEGAGKTTADLVISQISASRTWARDFITRFISRDNRGSEREGKEMKKKEIMSVSAALKAVTRVRDILQGDESH